MPGKGLALDISCNRPASPNAKYVVQLVDDASRYRLVAIVGTKVEAAQKAIELIKTMALDTDTFATWIRCDNGTDINIGAIREFCVARGTRLEPTPTYSPEQDGASEIGFRIIFTRARSTMIDMGIPQEYWPYVVMAVVELINCTASKSVVDNKTPSEMYWGHVSRHKPRLLPPDLIGKVPFPSDRPKVDWPRILGPKVVVRIVNNKASKTEARGESGILVGWQGHHLYQVALESSKKIVISRDVRFREELWDIDPTKIIKMSYGPGTFRDRHPRRGGGEKQSARRENQAADDLDTATQDAANSNSANDEAMLEPEVNDKDSVRANDMRVTFPVSAWKTEPVAVPDSVFASLFVANPDLPTYWEVLKTAGTEREQWFKAIDE